MSISQSPFEYLPIGTAASSSDVFTAVVPAGICTREGLFDAYESELRLPHGFGRNWDALDECLRDLSWIAERRVSIIHRDLPALPKTQSATYLEILAYCVRDWKPGERHQLIVVFPSELRDKVESVTRPAQQ